MAQLDDELMGALDASLLYGEGEEEELGEGEEEELGEGEEEEWKEGEEEEEGPPGDEEMMLGLEGLVLPGEDEDAAAAAAAAAAARQRKLLAVAKAAASMVRLQFTTPANAEARAEAEARAHAEAEAEAEARARAEAEAEAAARARAEAEEAKRARRKLNMEAIRHACEDELDDPIEEKDDEEAQPEATDESPGRRRRSSAEFAAALRPRSSRAASKKASEADLDGQMEALRAATQWAGALQPPKYESSGVEVWDANDDMEPGRTGRQQHHRKDLGAMVGKPPTADAAEGAEASAPSETAAATTERSRGRARRHRDRGALSGLLGKPDPPVVEEAEPVVVVEEAAPVEELPPLCRAGWAADASETAAGVAEWTLAEVPSEGERSRKDGNLTADQEAEAATELEAAALLLELSGVAKYQSNDEAEAVLLDELSGCTPSSPPGAHAGAWNSDGGCPTLWREEADHLRRLFTARMRADGVAAGTPVATPEVWDGDVTSFWNGARRSVTTQLQVQIQTQRVLALPFDPSQRLPGLEEENASKQMRIHWQVARDLSGGEAALEDRENRGSDRHDLRAAHVF
eukprot:gnl/TRDRNA2_/TRDRNA2_151337_c1_seq1.p1 gnl/TRDRNA2_/TRDRNA2_151337_c1~~gnl/TRDRNA2_/TRDRNA2_151337_c1_seq1.p1  ORF type:complete len:576 (+),score=165.25 gnl/TRDRNA2_/TRDRNA2_151337_c1_seq1:769-2496(+)